MKTNSTRILIFTRYPTPGQAKTRLVPVLGPERAARLSRRMTEHAMGAARAVSILGRAGLTVCFTGAGQRDFRAWLGEDLHFVPQPSGDLGIRLCRAFETAFRGVAGRAIAVGSDIPGISPEILLQAVDALPGHDVVLGPAADGGYYLIGMKHFQPCLFRNIDWGTGRVYGQTCDAINHHGLSVFELPMLSDIDRPDDLSLIRDDPRFSDVFDKNPLISVIIPTLNEAGVLSRTLDRVSCSHGVEIIVSDGGSQDATREIASRSGAVVMRVSGGRAVQMNRGAAAANGHAVLFLHADTLLPAGYGDLIRRALDNPSTVAGVFRFQTDESGMLMRLVERMTNLRSTVLQWPYGDQGLFMEKRIFDEMGGFPVLPIMEDFELVRRLRRRGTVATLREPVVISGRRWQRLGILRTTLYNQLMIAGFLAGVEPARLYRLYHGINRNLKQKEKEDRS